ncbi:MAG: hypothetical protein ACC642_09400 [Pseudomonadales bacterium]
MWTNSQRRDIYFELSHLDIGLHPGDWSFELTLSRWIKDGRMIESAIHLVDHVLPEQPIRQWVLTFPYPLRFQFAAQPQVLSKALGVVYRAISTCLIEKVLKHIHAVSHHRAAPPQVLGTDSRTRHPSASIRHPGHRDRPHPPSRTHPKKWR